MADYDRSCNLCMENFDEEDHIPKILPCREGHICCLQCVRIYTSSPPDDNSLYRRCIYYGANCNPALIHFECPFCRDVTHIPRDGILSLSSFWIFSRHRERSFEARRQLRRRWFLFKESRRELNGLMKQIVRELNKHHFNCNIARLSGSVTSAIGGVVAGVGLILIPFTLGASVILSIAGGVCGISRAVTAIGATAVETIISTAKRTKIEEKWRQSNFLLIDVEDQMRQASYEKLLLELADIFQLQKDRIVLTGLSMFSIARAALQFADVATDITGAAASFARVATVTRILGIVGSAVGVLLLPLDIICVVMFAKAIHNNTPSQLANRLDEIRKELKTTTDTFNSSMEDAMNNLDGNLSIEP